MEYDKEQITIQMIHGFVDFKNKIVLEIGCGEGMTSSLLADSTQKYIGIDPDSQSIQTARSLFKNVDFRTGRGEFLEFENGCFDIVLFTLSLHHQQSQLALKEANRVLGDKGQVLILEPSVQGELQQFFHLFNDETQAIHQALENIKTSQFHLEQQGCFSAQVRFKNRAELCAYPFDRGEFSLGDADRIMGKLNQFKGSCREDQPICLNDTINIYCLAKQENQTDLNPGIKPMGGGN